MSDRRCVILAGGKGTRLRPYTSVFPKPLVPLGERPIIDIIMRQLHHYGFRRATLSVGYLAELLQSYFATVNDGFPDMSLDFVKETKPLGTAGPLAAVKGLDETFIVMNGDVLTTLDYSRLYDYHKAQGNALTISVYRRQVKIDFGVLELGEANVVQGYIEKPEHQYSVSMGVYVYEPHVLEYIEKDTYLDFPDLVVRMLDNKEKVGAYPFDGFWLDIGRHDDYATGQEIFSQNAAMFLPGS
ncbi:MAG: sugar phosphate nucleotidyltransferase [Desulfovibrionaceae bacterium]